MSLSDNIFTCYSLHVPSPMREFKLHCESHYLSQRSRKLCIQYWTFPIFTCVIIFISTRSVKYVLIELKNNSIRLSDLKNYGSCTNGSHFEIVLFTVSPLRTHDG